MGAAERSCIVVGGLMSATEPTTAVYSAVVLKAYIERYQLHDADGLSADDTGWSAVYDLNAAAGGIWLEKSGGLTAEDYDTQESVEDVAGSGTYKTLWRGKSEIGRHALRMARHYWARRAASSVSVLPVDDGG